MIRPSTVFIIGAGASTGVDYPVGSTLSDQICEKLQDKSSGLFQAVASIGDHNTEERLSGFCTDFHASGFSLDQFIEHNDDYRDIGRFVIAHELIDLENEAALLNKARKCWYRRFKKLLGPTLTDLAESRVTIITFNYDRSLDHYLHLAFRASGGRNGSTPSATADGLKNLGFLHMHGALSPLPWQNPQIGRPYAATNDLKVIQECGRRLLLAHEQATHVHAGKPVNWWIEDATYVIFLGFGFGKHNMAKLGLGGSMSAAPGKFFSSSLNLDPRVAAGVQTRLGVKFFPSIDELLQRDFNS